MKKSIIVAVLSVLFLAGCLGGDNSKKEWTSLIYPDKENTKRSKASGVFNTLEECKKKLLLMNLKNLDYLQEELTNAD